MNTLDDQIAFFVFQKQYEILCELYPKCFVIRNLLDFEDKRAKEGVYDYKRKASFLQDKWVEFNESIFQYEPFINVEIFAAFLEYSKSCAFFICNISGIKVFISNENIIENKDHTSDIDIKLKELCEQISAFVHENHGHKE